MTVIGGAVSIPPLCGFRAPQIVFVYGSLKRGFANNYLLSKAGKAMYLGEYLTKHSSYTLLSYGGFPALIQGSLSTTDNVSTIGNHVKGEAYLVTPKVLDSLDMLEGEGSFYHRVKIKLDDETVAFTYIIKDASGLTKVPAQKINGKHIQEWTKEDIRRPSI